MRSRLQNLTRSLRPSSKSPRRSPSRASSSSAASSAAPPPFPPPLPPSDPPPAPPASSSLDPSSAAASRQNSYSHQHPSSSVPSKNGSMAVANKNNNNNPDATSNNHSYLPSFPSTSLSDAPRSWHEGPKDGFHGKITPEGPFTPEVGRYHLYVGLFCPFAHRALLALRMKGLEKWAGIGVSVVRPYPKGDENGWPGWRFNLPQDESPYEGADVDPLFGSEYMHELYFRADKDYAGRYSVPVLWDKKLNTIVNNESLELLRDLQTCFNSLLPPELAEIDLYPRKLSREIDRTGAWMQRGLNTGVYKTGFAQTQSNYEANLPGVFASLNQLEKIAKSHLGPYLLGSQLTELDIRAYATIIRFDTVYVQHFKCNLGMIRYSYPILHNWMKNLYWNHPAFHDTTDFRHIKENYTKSHPLVNPLAITPVGPWPDVEKGYYRDWRKIEVGGIRMPQVLEWEERLERE